MKKHTIRATPEWIEELDKMPFISSKYLNILKFNLIYLIGKNGKTLNLLKASSKKINPNKRRKIIPLLGTIKEFQNAH